MRRPVTKTIVITGCDENHYDLASELLESLRALETRRFDIGFLQHGTVPLPPAIGTGADIVAQVDADASQVEDGEGFLLARLGTKARLPEYFPGYDLYIWLDGDTWVQNGVGLDQIAQCAQLADLCAHPQADPNYLTCRFPDNYTMHTYDVIYGREVRSKFARFQMVNSGVFGARASSPLWAKWAAALDEVRQRLEGQDKRFFSDQIPLHKLIFSGEVKLCPLRAVNNWLVGHCTPAIDLRGRRLRAPSFPFEEIHIVHLVGYTKRHRFQIAGRSVSFRYRDVLAEYEKQPRASGDK